MKFALQRLELRRARRAEGRALSLLGASLPPSPRVSAIDGKLAALETAMPLSLARDRDDWPLAPAWARWLVALRGILDRLVLRALRHRASADRRQACAELGLASLAAPGELARAAREAHARADAIAASLQPLPVAVSEAQHLGRALVKEARGMLLPRLPGLAGLAAGWWIAQTFTDSDFSAMLSSWGLGSGPRHAVGHDTLKLMSFCLPLLTAAVCSYLGTRLSALVNARYGNAERQR